MTHFTPFHHPKRECHWCQGSFKPLDTLSPHSSEHFCSAVCAAANHQARALELVSSGAYVEAQRVAIAARAKWASEVSERLRKGREKTRQHQGDSGDDSQ